jgi:Tol biopolymer transport system component
VRRVVVLVAAAVVAAAAVGAMVAFASVGPTPGEVYRFWLDGRQIDVSRSAADDTFPVVSPNGLRVAFVRNRVGGAAHLYVVGTDGNGLERVSSALQTDQSMLRQVAWSPDSKRLAVAWPGGVLYVIGPGRDERLWRSNSGSRQSAGSSPVAPAVSPRPVSRQRFTGGSRATKMA